MTTICRPFITLKNGRVLYASAYGKRAFCFEVSDELKKCATSAKKKRTISKEKED